MRVCYFGTTTIIFSHHMESGNGFYLREDLPIIFLVFIFNVKF